MKILFICNEYPPDKHGGIGVFVKNLANNLKNNGFECVIIGIYPILEPTDEIIDNIRVIRITELKSPFWGKMKVLKVIKLMLDKAKLSFYIRRFEKKTTFNLIESYEWNGPLMFKPKTKLIIRLHGSNTAHSLFEGKKTNLILKWIEKRNINFANNLASVSKHILEITENSFGKLNKPKQIIYNSYNDDLFNFNSAINRNQKKIIFVGKYHKRKGVIELFKILNELFKLDKNLSFEFVGSHSSKEAIQLLNLINEDFKEQIKFTNAIPQADLPKLYNESILMIMPSRAEAFGLTAIEAMSCGCIVAMSDIPVAHEIITNNEDGLLINIYNYKETAQKIHSLLQDPKKIKKLRESALQKIKGKFSSIEILNENIQFYKSLINDN